MGKDGPRLYTQIVGPLVLLDSTWGKFSVRSGEECIIALRQVHDEQHHYQLLDLAMCLLLQ